MAGSSSTTPRGCSTTDSDWPWVTPRPAGKRQDLYFFGYGHDYRGALADFTKVAGRIPMPPRFAFGIWWSRYWAYTDEEFEQLVRDFEARTLPLDVLVVDMDWHLTFGGAWDDNPKDQSGHTKGWTGFTWDRNYFPDPAGFLDVDGRPRPAHAAEPAPGLRHPAVGIAVPGDGESHGHRSGVAEVRAVRHRRQEVRDATSSTWSSIRSRSRASISGGSTGSRATRRRSRGSTRRGG